MVLIKKYVTIYIIILLIKYLIMPEWEIIPCYSKEYDETSGLLLSECIIPEKEKKIIVQKCASELGNYCWELKLKERISNKEEEITDSVDDEVINNVYWSIDSWIVTIKTFSWENVSFKNLISKWEEASFYCYKQWQKYEWWINLSTPEKFIYDDWGNPISGLFLEVKKWWTLLRTYVYDSEEKNFIEIKKT